MAQGVILSAREYRELQSVLTWFRNGAGRRPGAGPDGLLARPLRFHVTSPTGIEGAEATIGGVLQFVRWNYVLVQQRWNFGSAVWENMPDGLVVPATNAYEDHNDDEVIAPGYKVETLPEGFAYQPVGRASGGLSIKVVLPATPEVSEDGDIVWKFWFENAMDGLCPPPE